MPGAHGEIERKDLPESEWWTLWWIGVFWGAAFMLIALLVVYNFVLEAWYLTAPTWWLR